MSGEAGMKNIGLRCTPQTHRRLRVLAAQRGTSLGEAVEYLLDRNEQREGGESK